MGHCTTTSISKVEDSVIEYSNDTRMVSTFAAVTVSLDAHISTALALKQKAVKIVRLHMFREP